MTEMDQVEFNALDVGDKWREYRDATDRLRREVAALQEEKLSLQLRITLGSQVVQGLKGEVAAMQGVVEAAKEDLRCSRNAFGDDTWEEWLAGCTASERALVDALKALAESRGKG